MDMDSGSEWQGKGALEALIQERIRATIESIVQDELESALGRGTVATCRAEKRRTI